MSVMADQEVLDALGVGAGGEYHQDAKEYYNIQTLTRTLNTLKPVTNDAAKTLIYQSGVALDRAISLVGRAQLGRAVIPNEIILNKILKDSKEVQGHLKWHADNIKGEPNKIYGQADDLKKYVIMAFETYNEALQGVITDDNSYLFKSEADSAKDFYQHVIQTFAALITSGKKVLSQTTNYLKWGIGLIAVGAIGYGAYQLKMAKYRYGSPRRLEEGE